ncbi:MAG: hypothetical protein FJX36_00590 [Alphaproteobacteria bacterium]|nr:hypothetical protein [Alphaproteobacteria bacterium]
MHGSLVLHLIVALVLLPTAVLAARRGAAPWPAVVLAVVGSVGWAAIQITDGWLGGFSGALWLTIGTTTALFAGFCLLDARVRALGSLGYPYLFILALAASVWSQVPVAHAIPVAHLAWFTAHVLIAVVTYGLLTLAAVAAVAVLVQERALKARRPLRWPPGLPSIADSEAVEWRLLLAGEVVFGLGLASGVGTLLVQHGPAALDHKVVLSVLAFLAVGGVLVIHARSGLRGRRAAHWVLAGYLLLTLAYPGVKFVQDVLIG